MKTILELEREGASAAAANNKLIEPVPRTIGHDIRWLLNRTTGYVELNHPMLAQLGDTIYVEYEPSKDELARLKMGQRVLGAAGPSANARRIDLSAAPSMKRPLAQEAKFGLESDIFGDLAPEVPEPVRAEPVAVQRAKAQADITAQAMQEAKAARAAAVQEAAEQAAAEQAPEEPTRAPRPPAPPGLFADPASPNKSFAFGSGYKPAGKK